MVNSAGILKRMKKLKDFVGKGASWINNNVVKPLRPVIDTGLDIMNLSPMKKVIDVGSGLVDKWDEYDGRKTNIKPRQYIEQGMDYLMDSQRTPSERKYKPLF